MTGTGEHASRAGDSGLVLVLNSGSSSVKFALVNPGSCHRMTDSLATARLIATVAAAGRDR